MRISKSASIIAALTLGITGALALTENSADAATVATVTAPGYARLYTRDGNLVRNRALQSNTPWLVGKIVQINGTTFYQVATNEYLSSNDSALNGSNLATSTLKAKVVLGRSQLYNDQTNSVEGSHTLGNGTEWKVGRVIVNKNNQVFVQVSPHEFADGSLMLFNQKPTNVEYISSFGLAVANNASSEQQSSLGQGTWTDTNSNAGSNSNSNSNTTANNNSASVSVAAAQQAILTSINNERATKGIAPLTMDASMNQAAMTRASEISQSFSHTRPNGTPCFTAFPSYSAAEENIYMSSNSMYGGSATKLADNIMDSFRAENFTPSHYTNVMSTDVTKIGIGVYTVNGNTYVAQDFIN